MRKRRQIILCKPAAHHDLKRDYAEAIYKELLLRQGPFDRAAASSLLGILYCQTQRPDEAAPLLERAPASDWVAHEFMGYCVTLPTCCLRLTSRRGVYMLLARRLMSVNGPEQEKQRRRALRLAAREFNSSLSHYTPQPPPGYLQVALAVASACFICPDL